MLVSALYADLMHEYRFDLFDYVRRLDRPPSAVVALIDRLPLGSRYMSEHLAKELDGEWRDFLDKGVEWWTLADLYDAINQNTRVSGGIKKKLDPYPRPGKKSGKGKKKKPQSLRELVAMMGGPVAPTAGGTMWHPQR